MVGYEISDGDEMLAVMGLGIKDAPYLTHKHFILPFQKCTRFKLTPLSYELKIPALSKEKIPLHIPVRFTIGPDADNHSRLIRYARLLVIKGSLEEQEKYIREKVMGILRGETRGVAASMNIDDIMANRALFRERVSEYVAEPLQQFGMTLVNVNIKEMDDNSGYFAVIGERFRESTNTNVRISVAENQASSQIGALQRESRATMETSRLKAEQAVYENERIQTVKESDAALEVQQANYDKSVKVAQVEGSMQARFKQEMLQLDLQRSRYHVELEKLRGTELAKVVVEGERIQKFAESNLYERQVQADTQLFEKKREAEGNLYTIEREAEGIEKMLKAQADGVTNLMEAFKSPEAVLGYLAVEKEVYTQVAAANQRAIQSIEPKIHVWNTSNNETQNALRELAQDVAPLLVALQDQSGVTPPQWMVEEIKYQPATEAQITELPDSPLSEDTASSPNPMPPSPKHVQTLKIDVKHPLQELQRDLQELVSEMTVSPTSATQTQIPGSPTGHQKEKKHKKQKSKSPVSPTTPKSPTSSEHSPKPKKRKQKSRMPSKDG